MTYGEAQRIARDVRRPVWDCVEIRHDVGSAETDRLVVHGEDLADLVVEGKALYLPRQSDGSCAYLRGVCLIPHSKPALCALFPFSRSRPSGAWMLGAMVGASGFCLAQDAAAGSVDRALELFGTTRNQLDRIYGQWLIDLRQHGRHMRHLRKRETDGHAHRGQERPA